ncbi:MAG: autotransporter-associated beta strand repeat-containing protein [Kiritimatiellae bacterium]|nr:autotransporter-associated beta strand repeat-containing protein [Kiritimatiellia bacterium]
MKKLQFTLIAVASLACALNISAATLYWDGTDTSGNADGGSGIWNSSALNWKDAATGGSATLWSPASEAVFGGAAGIVTLGNSILADKIFFNVPGYEIATAGYGLTLSVLAGTEGFTKSGAGTLTVTGQGSYPGNITVSGGMLKLGASWSVLGDANAAVGKLTVTSGATFDVAGYYDTNYGLTLEGGGTAGQGAYINTGADTGSGRIQFPNIALTADTTIGGTGNFYMIAPGYAANTLTLNGHTLTKVGMNTFHLVNTTVTAGKVHIVEGGFGAINAGSSANRVAVTLSDIAGASLVLNNRWMHIGSLAGGGSTGGGISLGSGDLYVGALNTSTVYAGAISGTGRFFKRGSGTLTLGGASTHTGETVLESGQLNIIGSLASAITVRGGRVAGTGSTTGLVTMNGGDIVLAGGTTTQGLTANGMIVSQPTTVMFDAAPVSGTVYDVFTYGNGAVSNLVDLTLPYRGNLTNDTANNKLTFTATVDGHGTRTWNTTSGIWDLGATANWLEGDHLFYAGDNVIFGDIDSDAEITLNNTLYPGSMTVSNAANRYVFQGGAIAGVTDLIKSGAGTLVLSNANSFVGTTRVNQGILKIGHKNALGPRRTDPPVSQVLVSSGGTVDFNGVIDAVNGYTIAGSGVNNMGALSNTGSVISNNNAQCSNIRLASDASISGKSDWALLTWGHGPTALDLDGHTLTKSGTNTIYLCNTTISTGTIHVVAGAVGQTASSIVNGSQTKFILDDSPGVALKLAGAGLTAGALEGGGAAGGSVSLGWGNLTVGALNTPSSFAGAISGWGSLIKTGTNTWIISGKNFDFTGPVVVNGGILKLGAPGASQPGEAVLGQAYNGLGKVIVNAGATLDLAGFENTDYGFTLAGVGTKGQGALINTGGHMRFSQIQTPFIGLSADAMIGGTGDFNMIARSYTANALTLNGFTLTKAGPNTFSLVNTTVTTGSIHIAEGALALYSTASDASAAAITLSDTPGAALALNNQNLSVGSLAGGGGAGGQVSLGSGTLTVGALNADAVYTGKISGSGGLVKSGGGRQTLAGANAYSGSTVVSGGTLLLNGSHTGGSGYRVNAGAVLGGAGEVNVAVGTVEVQAGAALAPGAADQAGGTLTLSTLTMAAAATLAIDHPADKVFVTGALALDNTSVAVLDFGMLNSNVSYPILTCSGNITGTFNKDVGDPQWIVSRRGNTFWLVRNSGAIILLR